MNREERLKKYSKCHNLLKEATKLLDELWGEEGSQSTSEVVLKVEVSKPKLVGVQDNGHR